MRVKSIVDETFQDYKKPAMLISAIGCTWKCLVELGLDTSICQNCELAKQKTIDIQDHLIVQRYIDNNITSAIVFGGLEPMLQFDEMLSLIKEFRIFTDDDIVIYTGYYPEEIQNELSELSNIKNIILKFGRYMPNRPERYDDILGIKLVSDNQYGAKLTLDT